MAISAKCTRCLERKRAEEFYPHNSRPNKLRAWCKECDAEDNSSREEQYAELRKKYRDEYKEIINRKRRQKYHDKKDKGRPNQDG